MTKKISSSECDVTDIRCKSLPVVATILLRPSEDGEYEDYYVPVMAACAGMGQVLFDDWVDWVLLVTMVRKMKIFCHLNGEVSVTTPARLHCTHLLKSKTQTGHQKLAVSI